MKALKILLSKILDKIGYLDSSSSSSISKTSTLCLSLFDCLLDSLRELVAFES